MRLEGWRNWSSVFNKRSLHNTTTVLDKAVHFKLFEITLNHCVRSAYLCKKLQLVCSVDVITVHQRIHKHTELRNGVSFGTLMYPHPVLSVPCMQCH